MDKNPAATPIIEFKQQHGWPPEGRKQIAKVSLSDLLSYPDSVWSRPNVNAGLVESTPALTIRRLYKATKSERFSDKVAAVGVDEIRVRLTIDSKTTGPELIVTPGCRLDSGSV